MELLNQLGRLAWPSRVPSLAGLRAGYLVSGWYMGVGNGVLGFHFL